MSFQPFSDVATCLIHSGQTIENSTDRVTFYGGLKADITRDQKGLTLARRLLGVDHGEINDLVRPILENIIRILGEVEYLPESLEIIPTSTTPNPFA